MPAYHTAFQGYSVRFSPFEEGKLAVATSQNFGIIGNGKQYVLQVRSLLVLGCTASSKN
jgi:peroxin-7